MSEETQKQENKETASEIVMSGKVPYLAIMGTVLKASKNSEDYFSTVDEMMSKDEKWDEIYKDLEDNPSHKNGSYFSFVKNKDSLDLAVSCLVVSSTNTFSNTKKDVLITPSAVYATQLVLEQVWKGKGKDFKPVKTLTRKGFKDNSISLSKAETSVIPVDDEIALLHGYFSRDTWIIISSIISPVDLPKAAYRAGDGAEKFYGLMFMIGEAYEALAMLCDSRESSWDEHIVEDFASISTSFTKEEKNEENNKLPSDEDK